MQEMELFWTVSPGPLKNVASLNLMESGSLVSGIRRFT